MPISAAWQGASGGAAILTRRSQEAPMPTLVTMSKLLIVISEELHGSQARSSWFSGSGGWLRQGP